MWSDFLEGGVTVTKDQIKTFIDTTWQEVGMDLVTACNGDYDMAVDGFKDDYAAMRLFDEIGWDKHGELSPVLKEVLAGFHG
jgi:hypothetical protein